MPERAATVLALDQGTSATKALVLAPEGRVLGEAEVPVHPRPVADGGMEQDPEELWESVVEAGRRALAAGGGLPIDAVGLANQGETVLAWDRATGRPHGPAIVWQDRRAGGVCARLAAGGWGERLAELTGLELDPYFAAPKITWLREQGAPGTITTTDSWLLHRLCGAFATDAATASRWLVLDLDAVAWSPEACEAFGLDPADLPEVVDNAGAVGETTAFGAPVPVAGLAVDQQAALFAEGCLGAGDAKCTYGTGAFLLASTGSRPVRSTGGLVGCVAWRLGGETTWCLDGQVFTVGSAVRWLQDVGLLAGPEDLDRLGGTVGGSGGASFVPGLAGLGAPFWAPDARGAFTGLSLATTRAELARAVTEGIAAQVAFLGRAAGADLGAPLTRLRVDGGLTRSRTLMQAQADLSQVPVECYPSPNATAAGVGALARLGCGLAPDAASAVGTWTPSAVYEPAITAAEADERLARWRRVAEATAAL